MATMDVFNSDAFNTLSLSSAVNKIPYQPSLLGSMNLFTKKRIRTKTAAIEVKEGTLSLIPTSQRGADLEEQANDKRKIHNIDTVRLAKGQTIYADEIQNVRAFGSESELQQVQAMVADRSASILNDLALTKENMMLGALQGIVVDADGSTELANWFTITGESQAAEIDFDLDNASPASGAVRKKCNGVIRAMRKAAKGGWGPGTYVVALCGDNFFDDLTAHPEVRETFLNQAQASDLRNDFGMPYESVRYGGIMFINYRGTDDGSTVAIGTDKCKFFPANAPGVFEEVLAPAEFLPYVNTMGQDFYSMVIRDDKRDAWVRPEIYSYPLHVCTRPGMLQRAKRT